MARKTSAPPTKAELIRQISEDTGLSKREVDAVFDSLNIAMRKSLRGTGFFTFPGLMKLKVVKKPATKSRKGINPFTGEEVTFKAKPASKRVRVSTLKGLKAMVG